MDEMKEWLEAQIDACEKLLTAIDRQSGRDSTKVAEYHFSKLAYEMALKKLLSIHQPIT